VGCLLSQRAVGHSSWALVDSLNTSGVGGLGSKRALGSTSGASSRRGTSTNDFGNSGNSMRRSDSVHSGSSNKSLDGSRSCFLACRAVNNACRALVDGGSTSCENSLGGSVGRAGTSARGSRGGCGLGSGRADGSGHNDGLSG
jgi:hypothetical protein